MITTLGHRKLKAIKKFLTPSEQFTKGVKEKFLDGFDAVNKKKSAERGALKPAVPDMRGGREAFFGGFATAFA